jgi:hypothetical protein
MGEKTKKETNHILNSLLTIGLIMSEGPIPSDKISEFLLTINNKFADKDDVQRYIKSYIKSWIVNPDQKIPKGTKAGYKLNKPLSNGEIEELLGTLLVLSLNDDRESLKLNKLIAKEGEPALSIVSKLVIVKKLNKKLTILLMDNDEPRNFKPLKILLDKDTWWVRGHLLFPETPISLKISDIKKATIS